MHRIPCETPLMCIWTFSIVTDYTNTTFQKQTAFVFSWRRKQFDFEAQTSTPPAGFEPTIPAGEQPQTDTSDRAATGIGRNYWLHDINTVMWPEHPEIKITGKVRTANKVNAFKCVNNQTIPVASGRYSGTWLFLSWRWWWFMMMIFVHKVSGMKTCHHYVPK
jgi:hypothetical protein